MLRQKNVGRWPDSFRDTRVHTHTDPSSIVFPGVMLRAVNLLRPWNATTVLVCRKRYLVLNDKGNYKRRGKKKKRSDLGNVAEQLSQKSAVALMINRGATTFYILAKMSGESVSTFLFWWCTLYLQRVHDFVRAERILHVAGIVALVCPLHVPQRQRIVRSDVGSVVKNPQSGTINGATISSFFFVCFFFYFFFLLSRRHLLLLQFHVPPTPFHRWTWITNGETSHIDVHPPRHHERHTERYYGCSN